MVTYHGEGAQKRRDFEWIIFADHQPIELIIPDAKLSFFIRLGDHKACETEYSKRVDNVLKAYPPSQRQALRPPSVLNLEVCSKAPILIDETEIGKGGCGTVHSCLNVSTAKYLAVKKFLDNTGLHEMRLLQSMKHVSFSASS